MTIRVTLNEDEVAVCELIAKRRRDNNREAGVVEENLGKEDALDPEVALQREVDGLGAEFAFAKANNLYPEFTSTPRKGGCELVGRTHARIDVKQTHYPHGCLIAHSKKETKGVDVFALVIGVIPSYNIIGWAYPKELLKEENFDRKKEDGTPLMPVPCYSLTQEMIKDFGDKYIFPQLLDDSRDWRKHERTLLRR